MRHRRGAAVKIPLILKLSGELHAPPSLSSVRGMRCPISSGPGGSRERTRGLWRKEKYFDPKKIKSQIFQTVAI